MAASVWIAFPKASHVTIFESTRSSRAISTMRRPAKAGNRAAQWA